MYHGLILDVLDTAPVSYSRAGSLKAKLRPVATLITLVVVAAAAVEIAVEDEKGEVVRDGGCGAITVAPTLKAHPVITAVTTETPRLVEIHQMVPLVATPGDHLRVKSHLKVIVMEVGDPIRVMIHQEAEAM